MLCFRLRCITETRFYLWKWISTIQSRQGLFILQVLGKPSPSEYFYSYYRVYQVVCCRREFICNLIIKFYSKVHLVLQSKMEKLLKNTTYTRLKKVVYVTTGTKTRNDFVSKRNTPYYRNWNSKSCIVVYL